MAYELNLFVGQGVDWSHNVFMYTVNSSGRFAADMSNWANGASQIRKSPNANATANIAVSIHSANSNGVITLSMNNQVTASINEGRYLYDVEVIKPEGEITQAVRGVIKINPQITQWDW